MRISALVVLIFVWENSFCLELEPVKDEAVFQGESVALSLSVRDPIH